MEARAVLDEMDTDHKDNVRSSMRMFLIWCVSHASSFLKHVCSHSLSDKKVTWLAEQNLLAVQSNHISSIQNLAASWFEMK